MLGGGEEWRGVRGWRGGHGKEPPSSLPTLQNRVDHRGWVNHIRGPGERWEVDSTVTDEGALARLIPLGRGKKGTPSLLLGCERKKTFSQEWVHLYGNTEKLPFWWLLEWNNYTWHIQMGFFSSWTTLYCRRMTKNQPPTVALDEILFHARRKRVSF